MSKLLCCDINANIEFELIFNDGEGYIYDKNNEDYLNWIPYKFRLSVGRNKYEIQGFELSLVSIKSFFEILESVVDERKYEQEYKEYEYCATEGEFTIYIKNTDEHYINDVITIKIWINSACLENAGSGYFLGFEFVVKSEDLSIFLKELINEVNKIIQ